MRALLLGLVVLGVSACTTVSEQTLQYCDTDSRQFIGLTISTTSDCIGISNSESGREINVPVMP